MRKTKATINDLHSGHRLGLLNPKTVLYQENESGEMVAFTPKLTASQEYLWSVYTDHIREAVKFADGCDLLLLVNGDLTQGNRYVSQWVSTRLSDQIEIAVCNLDPWFAYPGLKQVRISIGTAAHNFGEGSAEMLVGHILAERYPKVDIKIATHGILTYAGVTYDYAHHGPGPGLRDWLKGNVARFYLRDLMYREILAGRKPPDVVERAHFHAPAHEILETGGYMSEMFVVPSYCMADDHATQVTRSLEAQTHGMVLYECEEGRYRASRLYATLDTRMVEAI